MVEVAMRVNHVTDRLVRNQTLRLGDDRESARFALPRLDEGNVVLEVDRDDRVAAGDQVDAVAELLRLRRRIRRGCGSRRAASSLRCLYVDRRIDLHVADRQIEDRVAALPL